MSDTSITELLGDASAGDGVAREQLYRLVYAHLRKLAHSQRSKWVGNETMGTTALVNELYIKLSGSASFESRAHFFATASRALRQILVNYAEQQNRQKRGADQVRISFDDIEIGTEINVYELLALDEAIRELESDYPRRARVLEARLFGGLSVEETAAALGISTATVKRDWRLVRAWLAQQDESD
ncbi:MAG: ECF-type sigma factor [Pseudomonadota bacterium]